MGVQGITETDIANFLAASPGFFERHAELLGAIQLTSPHGQRAVSLQERQMEMLRDKIRGLEGKIIEMIRHGQDNVTIADKLHRWTRALMVTERAAEQVAYQHQRPAIADYVERTADGTEDLAGREHVAGHEGYLSHVDFSIQEILIGQSNR